MAVMRDMIPPFELYQPTEVDDAVRLMRQHGDKGWVLAGGLDTFDWFKDRIKRPEAVIDLVGVEELRGISDGADGGLDIGAMTSLTDVGRKRRRDEPLPAPRRGRRGLWRRRRSATRGLWAGTSCRTPAAGTTGAAGPATAPGGNVCYAATSQSMNREHCIMGASRCVAVSPSDTAPRPGRAGRRDGGGQHLR